MNKRSDMKKITGNVVLFGPSSKPAVASGRYRSADVRSSGGVVHVTATFGSADKSFTLTFDFDQRIELAAALLGSLPLGFVDDDVKRKLLAEIEPYLRMAHAALGKGTSDD